LIKENSRITRVIATFVLFQRKINFKEEQFRNLEKHDGERWQEPNSVFRSPDKEASLVFVITRKARVGLSQWLAIEDRKLRCEQVATL
jgi:hypothetical protein